MTSPRTLPSKEPLVKLKLSVTTHTREYSQLSQLCKAFNLIAGIQIGNVQKRVSGRERVFQSMMCSKCEAILFPGSGTVYTRAGLADKKTKIKTVQKICLFFTASIFSLPSLCRWNNVKDKQKCYHCNSNLQDWTLIYWELYVCAF